MCKTQILKDRFGARGPNTGHLNLARLNSVAGLGCLVKGWER